MKADRHFVLKVLLLSRVAHGFQSPSPFARSHRQRPPLRALELDELVNSDLLALAVSGGLVGGLALAVDRVSKAVAGEDVAAAPTPLAPKTTVYVSSDAVTEVEAAAVAASDAPAEAETTPDAEASAEAAPGGAAGTPPAEDPPAQEEEGAAADARAAAPVASDGAAEAAEEPAAEEPAAPPSEPPTPRAPPLDVSAPSKEVLDGAEKAQARVREVGARETRGRMRSRTSAPPRREEAAQEAAAAPSAVAAPVEAAGTARSRGRGKAAKVVGLALVAGAATVARNAVKAYLGRGML